jgi:hypothetical protein
VKACGAGVVGSVVSFSGTAAADRDEPYDGGRETMIETRDGDKFAEIHTAVTGPKQIDADWSDIKMALAMPVSYSNTGPVMNDEGLNNVEIRCELTSSPVEGRGFDFARIDPYSPGESDSELSEALEYAIDVVWDNMPWSRLGAPSPSSLISDADDTSISNRNAEFCIEREGKYGVSPPSADWKVDFEHSADSGGVSVGDWTWELTASADVGFWSTGTLNPGFNTVGEFTHRHEIELTVNESA